MMRTVEEQREINAAYARKYRIEHPGDNAKRCKKYYDSHLEERKAYLIKNREEINSYARRHPRERSEYGRAFRKSHPGENYINVKKWRALNPERWRMQGIRYNNKHLEERHSYGAIYHLKKEYDMTVDDYNKLFEQQKGCCAICGRHQTDFDKRLSVDHNHTTAVIRGLLCVNCNSAIGFLRDDAILLKKALEYLEKE